MWVGGIVLRKKRLIKKAHKDWSRRFNENIRSDMREESFVRECMPCVKVGRSEPKEVADDT